MRMNRIYDGAGGFDTMAEDPQVLGGRIQDNTPVAPDAGGAASAAPEAPATPSENPGPGPNNNPAPQGGNPGIPQNVPPAVVSSVPGVQGSETTGGVQGSFGQAGDASFSKRFGLPAAWFRGGPTAGLAREAGNSGRAVLGRGAAGQVTGGAGAETVGVAPTGPSMGSEGGGKNDEEWQRLMRAVLQNRFKG